MEAGRADPAAGPRAAAEALDARDLAPRGVAADGEQLSIGGDQRVASTREVHWRQLGPVVCVKPEDARAVSAVGVPAGEVDLTVERRRRRMIDRDRQARAGTPGRAVERINRVEARPGGVEAAHHIQSSALRRGSSLLDRGGQRGLLALCRQRSGRGKGAESDARMSRRWRRRDSSTAAAAHQQRRDPQQPNPTTVPKSGYQGSAKAYRPDSRALISTSWRPARTPGRSIRKRSGSTGLLALQSAHWSSSRARST